MSRREHRRQSWATIGLVLLTLVTLAASVAALRVGRPDTAGATAPVPTPTRPVAFFFGDSYFNGANGVPVLDAMAYRAGTALGYETVVGGHGGTGFVANERPPGEAKNYQQQIAAGGFKVDRATPVRLVVIEGGLNDVGVAADVLRPAVALVIAKAAAAFPSAKIVVVGPPAPTGVVGSDLRVAVDAVREGAQGAGVPFLDASHWIVPSNVSQIIGSDRTHPSAIGHGVLGKRLADELRKMGLAAGST